MSFAPTLPINYVNDNASSPLLGYIDSSSETKIVNTIASSIIAKTKDVSLPWLICEVDGMATRSIVKVIDVIVAAKKAKNDPFPPPPPPLDMLLVSVLSISKLDIYMNSDDETTTTPTTVGSSALTTQARDDCYRESVLLPPPLPTTTTTTTPPPPPPPHIELLTLSPHTPCIATVISFLNDNDRRTVRVTTCYLRDAIDGYNRIVTLDSTMLAAKQQSSQLITEAIGIMKWKTRLLDRSNFEEAVIAPQQSLEGRRCYMVTNVNDVMTDNDDDDDDAIDPNPRRNILAEMDDLLPDIPTRMMTRVLDMNDYTTDVISTVRDSIPMFVTVVTNNTDKDGKRDNEDKFEESKLRPLCSPFRLSYEEEDDNDNEEKVLDGKFNNVHDIIINTSIVKMSSDAEIQIPSSSNVISNFMTMDSDSVSSADDPFTGIANVIAELDELSSNPQYSRCHRKRNDDDSAMTLLKSNVITRNTIIEDDDTLSQTSDVVIFGQTTKAYTQFMYEIMDDVRAFIGGGGDDTVRIDDTGPIKIGNKFYSKSEAMRHWRKAKKKLAYTELVNECNDEMDNLTIKEQQTPFFLVEKVGHTLSTETHHIENREIVSTDMKYTLKPINELTESPNEIIAVSENVGVARSSRCIANEELCIDKKKIVIADTVNRSLPSAQDVLNDTIVMHELKQQQQKLENELFHQYHHCLKSKTPPKKVLAFSSFITNGEDIALIDDAKCNKSSSRSCVCIGNDVVDDDKVSSTSESTISTIVRRKIVSFQNIRSWGGSQVTPVSSYIVTEVQQHIMKANAALKLA